MRHDVAIHSPFATTSGGLYPLGVPAAANTDQVA
jgi:hypothetical protein